MPFQSFRTNPLTHSRPLLTKCLQAALIAAPLMVAAAPAQAAPAGPTVKTTVSGFTGAFAPINWNKTPTTVSGGNSATLNTTSFTLVKNPQNTTRVSANIDLTDSLFAALKPAGAGRVLSWSAKGTYNWSLTGTPTNNRYIFGVENNEGGTVLNTTAPITGGTYTIGASYLPTPFDPNAPDILDFSVDRASSATGGTGVATILGSSFEFVAEYDVPGPLPVVGAAAAFAWSRRLRNRLKSANTLA